MWDESNQTLQDALTPVYRDLVAEAGQGALALVAQQAFDARTDPIAQYFATRPSLVADAVNSETEKQLRASLTEGINAGESMTELADRVSEVFGALAGFRAERIARTETIGASTFATIQGWDQSGVVVSKEWFTAHDERVCLGCDAMDGEIIDLNTDYFDKGDKLTLSDDEGNIVYSQNFDFGAVDGPPLHGNCRCTILPIMA